MSKPSDAPMRKTIGILGGLGPESTIAFYRCIAQKYYALHHDYMYPEMLIYSFSFQPFIDAGYENAATVESAVRSLSAAGADFVVAACNSVHIVFEQLRKKLPIPWISIVDSTAEAIKRAGASKVALLGTIFTMTGGFYQKALSVHDLDAMLPSPDDQQGINRIIYEELVRGIVTDDARNFALECIGRLGDAGAQGVILACTELPFLLRQDDTDMPLFDSTVIHAQHALELALGQRRLES